MQDNYMWLHTWLDVAYRFSLNSPDPSTKVGAVLVSDDGMLISHGYNAFPRGVEETAERWERPLKYKYVVHAERNCICNAARTGKSTVGSTLYLIYNDAPCEECTKEIIQAGVSRIITGSDRFPGVGNGVHYDTNSDSIQMLEEARIPRISMPLWSIPKEKSIG